MNEFEIYTDGACSGNPGPGGWATVVINRLTGDKEEFSGGEKNTTNNRMELTAAIEGLKKISPGDFAEMFTDSNYLKNAFTAGWLAKWKRNGWRTATKNPVLNQDLWVELDKLVGERLIKFNWVKGHAGNFYNERCDKLARDEIQNPSGEKNSSGKFLGSSNPKLKLAKKLSAKKYREESGLFVAEGLRLCEEAAENSDIEFGFYTGEFLKTERAENLIERLEKNFPMYEISPTDFSRTFDTETPQGTALVVRQKIFEPQEVAAKNFLIALDGVSDPGNVGTIFRTADAFDCGVIVLEKTSDIFNPKTVRASMGAIFRLPVARMNRREFLKLMRERNFQVTATAPDSSAKIYFDCDFTGKSAIVFGNEAEGVSAEIFRAAEKIYIPMPGRAESLNVSAAAAIIISEVVRQRMSST